MNPVWLEAPALIVLLFVTARPLGAYIEAVFDGRPTFGSIVLAHQMLGGNGGGFVAANSSSPDENPKAMSFGKLVRDGRQGQTS